MQSETLRVAVCFGCLFLLQTQINSLVDIYDENLSLLQYVAVVSLCCRHKSALELQPIANIVAQNLEIISKNFQLSTRRTKILMIFIISRDLSLAPLISWE